MTESSITYIFEELLCQLFHVVKYFLRGGFFLSYAFHVIGYQLWETTTTAIFHIKCKDLMFLFLRGIDGCIKRFPVPVLQYIEWLLTH